MRGRRLVRWAALWTAVLVLCTGISLVVADPLPVRVTGTVNGRPVSVGQPATVAGFLREAGIEPRDGRLLSVVHREVLDPAIDPAVVTRNGEPTEFDANVRDGDVIRTEDGHDRVEDTVTTTEAVPFPGLPEVETVAWRPGVDGLARVVAGEVSGEEVSRETITAPLPAEPVPGPVVTLSFDDGPHPEWTRRILRILRRRNVNAVFCVVGDMIDAHPEIVERAHEDGHRLCDHTVSHPDLEGTSRDLREAEIGTVADRVEELTGERPAFFRSPYGVWTDPVIRTAHRHELRLLGWDVDTEDFQGPPATVLVQQVVDQVQPGSVILLHDGGGDRQATVDALPYLITALRRAGYQFALPPVTHPSQRD
jgi:peptidoglycan/xylan/chitin deacetylase (PgdA/CDA1 family)